MLARIITSGLVTAAFCTIALAQDNRVNLPLVMSLPAGQTVPPAQTPTPVHTATTLQYTDLYSRSVASAVNYVLSAIEDGDDLNTYLDDFPSGSPERNTLYALGGEIVRRSGDQPIQLGSLNVRYSAFGKEFHLDATQTAEFWAALDGMVTDSCECQPPAPVNHVLRMVDAVIQLRYR